MARTKHGSPTLVVKISEENYERAQQSKSGACLIADAIKAQYPHLSRVTVDMATIRATDRKAGVRYTWLSPSSAQHLLLSFDQGWPKPIDEVVVRKAVVISPIRRSPSVDAKRAEARAHRLTELEAKEAKGKLTNGEKRALGKLRNPKPAPARPTTTGKADVKVATDGDVTVYGRAPIVGDAHPNLLRGADRHFGAKLADPGAVFDQAVEAAVAQRLAEEGSASEA